MVTQGRVSLQPIHITNALPTDERNAVRALELHLWQRSQRRKNPALEVLPDSTAGVFLTVGHMQGLLRQVGSKKTGEKFARRVLREILPGLGLIEDTGVTKKPRQRPHPHQNENNSQNGRIFAGQDLLTSEGGEQGGLGQTDEGGRHAQLSQHRSRWWRVFSLPTVNKMLIPICGAYAHTSLTRPNVSASLSALLKSQGLISGWKRRTSFNPGSVQEAFWATGPP